jgi:hypothetical protein
MDDRTKERLLDLATATVRSSLGTVAAAHVLAHGVRDGLRACVAPDQALMVVRCCAVLRTCPDDGGIRRAAETIAVRPSMSRLSIGQLCIHVLRGHLPLTAVRALICMCAGVVDMR